MFKDIILIHRGNPEYLKYSLVQARNSNPNANIHLIGDESNNVYDFVNHYMIDEYMEDSYKFGQIYKHNSPNRYNYELFCFQRWFIIKDFINRKKINNFYYQDSDVMLYYDVSKFDLRGKIFAYCYDSGHTSFFNYNSIKLFCQFIMDYYSKNDLFKELQEIYQEKISKGIKEGISDMTLICLFANKNKEKSLDLSMPFMENAFDHNINCSDKYYTIYGKKKLFVNNDGIYCLSSEDKKFVRMNTLHCQGDAKLYMKFLLSNKIDEEEKVFDYTNCNWVDKKAIVKEKKIKQIKIKILERIKKIYYIVTK